MYANRNWLLMLIMIMLVSVPSATARATFHRWRITEAFSNSDGSLQYIELSTFSNGQELLSGHFTRTRDVNSIVINNFDFYGSGRRDFKQNPLAGYPQVLGSQWRCESRGLWGLTDRTVVWSEALPR